MVGTTISHYKILEKLGEGGMGVVYKAEDTRLKRTVALKFLPTQALGTDEEKARFVREAQAAAALSHPNITTVYEIDDADGETFIVMEYVEGSTLKEKIEKGPLRIKEAIKIAIQIAEGLQAAHEKGIVHRDIKSTNVMLTGKGQAKIMDFGLAKMAAMSRVTKEGTTLGTIAYMSPEQARGESVDYRSDIFSLGVILYEMISGQLPFKGEYEQAIVYSILNTDPEPLTALRTGVPIALDGIIAKLLAKDPEERYQHVDELPVDLKAIDLDTTSTSRIAAIATSEAAQHPVRLTRVIPWSIAVSIAIVFTLFGGLVVWYFMLSPLRISQTVSRSIITLPPEELLNITEYGNLVTISPDGKNVVYVAGDDMRLYLRPMDKFEATPLPGTERALSPFFSPDGQWVGFFADSKLKKVSLAGGMPLTICDTNPLYPHATWGTDNTIIFVTRDANLCRISASGGKQQDLTTRDPHKGKRIGLFAPELLPGGKAVLFSLIGDENSIAILNLETGEWFSLFEGGIYARYSNTGHIVFEKSGSLLAVPFDLHQLKVTGAPEPIIESVQSDNWCFSGDGTLVYIPQEENITNFSLSWLNRNGKAEPLTGELKYYKYPRISPDGKQVAVSILDNNFTDIWIYDLVNGIRNRLTFSGGYSSHPTWTPDSKRLMFASIQPGTVNLYLQPADGSEEAKQLLDSKYLQKPNSISPDGRLLAFYRVNPTTQEDIWILRIQDGSAESFLVTPANEHAPVFSPDGQWIAYMSDELGRYEVYAQPYPATGIKYQISTEGGTEPVWAPNGQEIYYRSGDKLMVVAVETEPTFRKQDAPQKLFEVTSPRNVTAAMYDVHPDGDRFLMVKVEENLTGNQINVVLNWFEELKQKVPTGN